MPICKKCGKMAASAEMRRANGGALCRDKKGCAERQKRANSARLNAMLQGSVPRDISD